jgi:hypothetical protein
MFFHITELGNGHTKKNYAGKFMALPELHGQQFLLTSSALLDKRPSFFENLRNDATSVHLELGHHLNMEMKPRNVRKAHSIKTGVKICMKIQGVSKRALQL